MIWPTRKSSLVPPLVVQPRPAAPASMPAKAAASAIVAPQRERRTDLKVDLHQRLIERINLSALDTMSREQIAVEVSDIVQDMLVEQNHALNLAERGELIEDILDELLGLGPLEPLLKDPTITDIMVNTCNVVFVERKGRIEEVKTRFKDDRHLLRIIQKIVGAVGRRVDESSPMVDARLADGSRLNAIIPPLAVDGPLLSIRKFSKTPIDMSKLVGYGALPQEAADVLLGVVEARRNVIISGGTGSGKTTMLNALSAAIDGTERILTIEDSAELQLQQRHVVRLETRPANIEGRGEINQRELVKNALRMRPDRIVLGEIRAGEAFDMLQAMNTGHDGSMTTVHANTPRDALSRIEQMIGMSGIDISPKSARSQIAAAIHVVLQLARLSDGSRRVMSISEVTGMEGETVLMQEIFRYKRTGMGDDGKVIGHFEATGIRPKFIEHLIARGIHLPPHLFDPSHKMGT
ncbi:CpaF family protein [Polymorphobacter sp. PAMC 29334]|uniref:CpaF family protein n=1 Tax=Polymorphobacter sp. PAMC 29334 TaxID=2862331 RepID=UPI001C67C7D8|nr:CpaF family protein [Polymorphobacter sp. PAMC 29334]QYE36584.1 CpaF family protein [Polymorphobacter sp. PAMC 29334]